jgi:hypothetical protein
MCDNSSQEIWNCQLLGFRNGAVRDLRYPACGAASLGDWCHTFRHNAVVSKRRVPIIQWRNVIPHKNGDLKYRIILTVRKCCKTFAKWTSWPLRMGPLGCPKTSVKDYHSTLRNISEERRSQQHHGGSLKSRKMYHAYYPFQLTNKNKIGIIK